MHKVGTCLSEVELNDYLSGVLSREKKAEAERHLADCGACLEKLVFAYQVVEEFEKTGKKGVKPMKPDWKRNLWLFGAIIAFALSFFVSRYFVQLLVATILMGTKWIFDSINARILIMIYEAWKKGGSDEASKILGTFNDRLNR
ncbi:MAG: zf-HC2 domain-containing protein [Candidatus Omnitrophota bacterium]